VLKQWKGGDKGGLSMGIARDHLLLGRRVMWWCNFAHLSSLAGQDGDGQLRDWNQAHERFPVTWTFFLSLFLSVFLSFFLSFFMDFCFFLQPFQLKCQSGRVR